MGTFDFAQRTFSMGSVDDRGMHQKPVEARGPVGDVDCVGGVGRQVAYRGDEFPELHGRRGRLVDWIDDRLVFVEFDPTPDDHAVMYRLRADEVHEV